MKEMINDSKKVIINDPKKVMINVSEMCYNFNDIHSS